MLVLKKVSKNYGEKKVLFDISLQINPGEFVCILGASGSGKSVLMNLLIGAELPTKGTVEVDGVDMRKIPSPAMQLYRRRLGMIFQDRKLFAEKTVWENVAFPLEVLGASPAFIRKRVPEILAALQLLEHANTLVSKCSASAQQRTAIARAIINAPLICIADEPMNDLDASHVQSVADLLHALHKNGATVIVMTHDYQFAEKLGVRTITIENGQTREHQFEDFGRRAVRPNANKHEVFGKEDTQDANSDEMQNSSKKKIKIISLGS